MSIQSRTRRGAAVLILGILFLLVLSAMQISQKFLTGQVTDQAARSIYGRIAQDLADSALAEARTVIASRMNDPADPLYSVLRKDVPEKSFVQKSLVPFDLTVAPASLPALVALQTRDPMKTYSVDPVAVRITPVRPFSPTYPREYEGILSLSCQVTATHHRGVTRKVERCFAFKLVQVTMPSPLNHVTLYLRTPYHAVRGTGASPKVPPETSTRLGVNANQIIDEVVRNYWPEFSQWWENLQNYDPPDSGFARAVKGAFDPLKAPDMMPRLAQLTTVVKPFPADPERFSFIVTSPTADLALLNLPGRLAKAVEKLNQIMPDVERLRAKVKDDFDNKRMGNPTLQDNQQYASARGEQVKALVAMLQAIADFQAQIKVVESTGPDPQPAQWGSLGAAYSLVEPFQLNDPVNLIPVLVQRATYVLEEDPKGMPGRKEINQKFADLKTRLDPLDRGLKGIVLIRNNFEPFDLGGTVAGQLTFVVAGKLHLKDLKLRDQKSFVTAVALGGTSGAVQVTGTVGASLIVTGRRLFFDPGARLLGSLLLWDFSVDHMENLTGTVIRDARLADVDRPEFFHAVVSPWGRSLEIGRGS